ncbi:MAG: NAD(P)H-dependent oxidoreductase [Candidatus Omnitrophica bacterium]|nr:NAD(P)H-dependent oxidoreductase [Candidatus Omnitrophota bacterium]MDD5487928.1 NAD(P)H-dependent oxidoreductase [Candidatus Omnitrophota bacterium]
MSTQILILIGSPKKKDSTSESIATKLKLILGEQGACVHVMSLFLSLNDSENIDKFFKKINSVDIITFISPVYVDSPPFMVLKFLEIISEKSKTLNNEKCKKIFAISLCGYPEAVHNELSLMIYKNFADCCGFLWGGGMSISMAPFIRQDHIRYIGVKNQNLLHSYEMLCRKMLSVEDEIDDECIEVAPILPKWLYLSIAHIAWYCSYVRNVLKRG